MSHTTAAQDTDSWILLRDELVGFVTKRVETIEIAEDIVQDVYLRLHRAEPGSITNPPAWLYRAARNATVDHYRTRRPTTPLDGIEHRLETPGVDGDGPNSATRELANCLKPLIAQLTPKYQTALTLVDLEGKTHTEAARLEGLSTSGMKSRVQRGRNKLGNLLTTCCSVATDTQGAISDYHPSSRCNCKH